MYILCGCDCVCVSVCEREEGVWVPAQVCVGGPGMFTVVCVGVPLCTQVCVSGVLGPGVSQVCVCRGSQCVHRCVCVGDPGVYTGVCRGGPGMCAPSLVKGVC